MVYIEYDNFNLTRVKIVPKEAELIVYCSKRHLSQKIPQKLTKAGYHLVQNLYGGIFEWVNQGNEVVDENRQE